MIKTDIIVVGAGAAGMMAAGQAALMGAKVLLLESNEKPGRKIGITGKGRCNVTNASEGREFMSNIVTNERFLFSALSRFGSAEMMTLLEEQGIRLKIERGNRVFPESDRSFDIIDGLARYVRRSGARMLTGEKVKRLQSADGKYVIETEKNLYEARAVVLATGGRSYTSTGSAGDGHVWAKELGHSIVPCRPGLIPFTVEEKWVPELMGLSLKNAAIYIEIGGKKVYEDFGEMLFAHFGISGPMILSASSRLQAELMKKKTSFSEAKPVLHLDLKPALSPEVLDQRLIREFEASPAREYRNFLGELLPRKMVSVMVKLSGIAPDKKVADIGREERQRLRDLLKDLPIHLTGTRPLEEAIVTMGGVSVREVDPKTMGSKVSPGLFLAGELLDIDALTGGFNLQLAFSTGRAAGEGAALYCEEMEAYQ